MIVIGLIMMAASIYGLLTVFYFNAAAYSRKPATIELILMCRADMFPSRIHINNISLTVTDYKSALLELDIGVTRSTLLNLTGGIAALCEKIFVISDTEYTLSAELKNTRNFMIDGKFEKRRNQKIILGSKEINRNEYPSWFSSRMCTKVPCVFEHGYSIDLNDLELNKKYSSLNVTMKFPEILVPINYSDSLLLANIYIYTNYPWSDNSWDGSEADMCFTKVVPQLIVRPYTVQNDIKGNYTEATSMSCRSRAVKPSSAKPGERLMWTPKPISINSPARQSKKETFIILLSTCFGLGASFFVGGLLKVSMAQRISKIVNHLIKKQ